MRIAILYIALGVYNQFWESFYKSMEDRFLVNCKKTYFVFTDDERLERRDNVEFIHKSNQKWPYNSLLRFDMFLSIQDKLKKYDYLFFFNANMYCNSEITEQMILPDTEELVVVQHPWFIERESFTYEENPESLAYIPRNRGEHYVTGGINGGNAKAFIEMSRILSENIHKDLEKGIIAVWHDESHLNKYILDYNNNFKLLPPDFMYPEGYDLPYQRTIVARDKKKYFDVNELKNWNNSEEFVKDGLKKAVKYEYYYRLLSKFWLIKNREIFLKEYLKKNGFEKIAIYGFGFFGKICFKEVKNLGKEEILFFDQDSINDFDKKLNGMNVIIVCAIDDFFLIKFQLEKLCTIPIISFEDIIKDISCMGKEN